MRLYPKKLRNIEDLEREKLVLAKEVVKLDTEELFSFDGLMDGLKSSGKKKSKKNRDSDDDEDGNGGLASLLSLIPISNPLLSLGMKILQARLSRPSAPKRAKKKMQEMYEEEKPHTNIIKKVAFEVLVGYLKWKAIELSYKGVKHLMDKRKARKAMHA